MIKSLNKRNNKVPLKKQKSDASTSSVSSMASSSQDKKSNRGSHLFPKPKFIPTVIKRNHSNNGESVTESERSFNGSIGFASSPYRLFSRPPKVESQSDDEENLQDDYDEEVEKSTGDDFLNDDYFDDISYEAAYGKKKEASIEMSAEESEGFIENIFDHVPGSQLMEGEITKLAKHVPGAGIVGKAIHGVDKGLNRGIKGVIRGVDKGTHMVFEGGKEVLVAARIASKDDHSQNEEVDERSNDDYSYGSDDSLFNYQMSSRSLLLKAPSELTRGKDLRKSSISGVYLAENGAVINLENDVKEEYDERSNSDDDDDCYMTSEEDEAEEEVEIDEEKKKQEEEDLLAEAKKAYAMKNFLNVTTTRLEIRKEIKKMQHESGQAIMEDVEIALEGGPIPGTEAGKVKQELAYNEEDIFGLAIPPLRGSSKKNGNGTAECSESAEKKVRNIEEKARPREERPLHRNCDIRRIEKTGNNVHRHRNLVQSITANTGIPKSFLETYDRLHDEIDLKESYEEHQQNLADEPETKVAPLGLSPGSAFSTSNPDFTNLECKGSGDTENNNFSSDTIQKQRNVIVCTAAARRTRRAERLESRPYWNMDGEEEFNSSLLRHEEKPKAPIAIKLPSISSFRGLPSLPLKPTSGGNGIMLEASSLAEWLDSPGENAGTEPKVEFGQPLSSISTVDRKKLVQDMHNLEYLLDEQEGEIEVLDEKFNTLFEANAKAEAELNGLEIDTNYLEEQLPELKVDIAQALSYEDCMRMKMESHINQRDIEIDKLSHDIDVLKEYICNLEKARDDACEYAQKISLDRKFKKESVWSKRKQAIATQPAYYGKLYAS